MVLEARRLAREQEGTGANEMLKISTPNQMLKRLPIALAQVKAGNNCIYQKKLLKKYTTT